MKIRTGFVSNSSSTSFCIYGIGIKENELINLLKPETIKKIRNEIKEREGEDECFEKFLNEYGENFDIREWLEGNCSIAEYYCNDIERELDIFDDGDYGYCYLGRQYINMASDQTKEAFEKETEEIIKRHLKGDFKCETIEETIY